MRGNLEKRWSDEQIIEALKLTGGAVYDAADRLGCSHETIYGRLRTVPAVSEARVAIRGRILDRCEQNVYASAIGNEEKGIAPNVEDAKWLLKHLARDRGYADKTEHEHVGPGGGPIQLDIGNLRRELLQDDDYLEFQRQKSVAVDRDTGDVCADGESRPMEDESSLGGVGSQAD